MNMLPVEVYDFIFSAGPQFAPKGEVRNFTHVAAEPPK
jgi:hypothetical protein